MDARYVGDSSALRGEYIEDPSYRDIRPAFYASFLHYLQTDLRFELHSQSYKDFSIEALLYWNWNMDGILGMPNFLPRLRRTLVANPHMKVFVGAGYYDLRTPFAAIEYSLDHLELPSHYRKKFQVEYYEAGHAYIFDLASLKKMKRDLQRFYAEGN
jgi:carboxypeptidase C (cathepsin A)